MADFAEDTDVTAVTGALNGDQVAALPGLLEQASTLLRGWGADRGIDIDAHIAGNDLRISIAKVAVVNAVKRSLGILDGAIETTVAIDDWRETTRRHQDEFAAGLYIADADLRGFLGKKGSRFGTIRLGAAL